MGQWFPFVSTEMTLRTYFWMLFNKITWVIMYYIVYTLASQKYKVAVFLFTIMESVLVIEFILNYNATWFSLPLIGQIGMTHFFIIFKGMLLLTLWRQQKQQMQ